MRRVEAEMCVNGVTSSNTSPGMTSQMTLGNGTVENFTFNERFQLTSQNVKRGSEVLQNFDYSYGQTNAAGEITPNSNNGQLAKIEAFIGAAKQRTQKFSYDSIGRLSKSEEYRGDTNALTYKQVFDFDRFGNLYRKTASNPTTGQANPIPFAPIEEATTPGTGDIDKATNRFRTGTNYDDAGQVLQDDKFRNMGFAYDANGRVVKATKANTLDAHTVYDALGNRVATKINDVWQYMIYDAFGQLVAEYGVPSDGLGGVRYVQQDHQGSVRTITNSNGFVVARTDHQAFGENIGSGVGLRNSNQGYGADVSTRQGYGLTENDDATGQQHTWFRKLETQAGRWSSPDPYKGSMNHGNPQSFNRYGYVTNDPIRNVDPSGLEAPLCMIDGMQVNCSTAFLAAGHGPFRISNGEAYVSIGAALYSTEYPELATPWEAGGAFYTYSFNLASYVMGGNKQPTGIFDPRRPGPGRRGEPDRPDVPKSGKEGDNPYGPCDSYLGVNARYMFRNGGESDWGRDVRQNLISEYRRGATPMGAHIRSYLRGSIRNPMSAPRGMGEAVGAAGRSFATQAATRIAEGVNNLAPNPYAASSGADFPCRFDVP